MDQIVAFESRSRRIVAMYYERSRRLLIRAPTWTLTINGVLAGCRGLKIYAAGLKTKSGWHQIRPGVHQAVLITAGRPLTLAA